jgi:hypothetical protein
VPTDSGGIPCIRKGSAGRIHTPRGPRPCSRCKRSRTAFAPMSVLVSYEFTNRAPGSTRAAGSRSTRTECPQICWHTIVICGNSQRYGKPLKQRGFLPRSGGHSSRCWCQRAGVERAPAKAAANGCRLMSRRSDQGQATRHGQRLLSTGLPPAFGDSARLHIVLRTVK